MKLLNQIFNTQLIYGLLLITFLIQPVAAREDEDSYEPSVRNGAVLWADTCARCHNLRRTDEFNDQQWLPIVNHMRVRAGLTAQEAADILIYLQASNSRD
jgi:hypothetical protein